MSGTSEQQIDQLRATISALEAQRSMLGDSVVDTALAPLRRQLVELEANLLPVRVEERRLITIVFVDIVNSSSIAEKLDPEDWRKIVERVHSDVGNIILRHGGQVIQYLGDGLLALFGAERTTERDPEEAIRSALEIQNVSANSSQVLAMGGDRTSAPQERGEETSKAETESSGPNPRPQLRIGIHTGPVVLGDLGSPAKREMTATGDAMNLAARLQSAAPAGGVLVSHETYRYVRGVFDVTPQPPLMVKGKSAPVRTYLVRRAKPRPFRSITRGVAGVETRLVGREGESRQLQEAYLDAFEHKRTRWMQLIGEPGVGKSRLMQDLAEWLELRPEDFWLFRGRAFDGDSSQPFALVRRIWFDRFQIAEDAPVAQAEAKWVRRFQDLAGTTESEPAKALGLLVGLPFGRNLTDGRTEVDPGEIKGRALVVSRELLTTLRRRNPIVVFLEDLEWADESSWEWLTEVLLQNVQGDSAMNGVFIVAAARPDWNPPKALVQDDHFREIAIHPLGKDASLALVQELLGRVDGVPESVFELLIKQSEGVPYYAEEMVNYFIDRGVIDRSTEPWRFVSTRFKELPLPATLQHLLLTRLSSLSDSERAALQRGAIFGRNFWSGGVEALGVRESTDVLTLLQPRGLVEAQEESTLEGDKEWSFHHQLLREVTYESVLKRERAELHRAAADWLEEQARKAGRLDEFAALLAEHLELAGRTLEAADRYLKGGRLAERLGALREAKRLYDRAYDLLPPVELDRRWQVLRGRQFVHLMLADAEHRKQDVNLLAELATQSGDADRLAVAYEVQSDFLSDTGQRVASLRAADQAILLARQAGNLATEIRASAKKSFTLARLGDSQSATELAQASIAQARDLGEEDPLLTSLIFGAIVFSLSGDYARAIALQQEQLEMVQRSGRLVAETVAYTNLGASLIYMGQYKRARPLIEKALKLCEERGEDHLRPSNLVNLGEVYYFTGDFRTALRLDEEALRAATGKREDGIFAVILDEIGLVLEATGDFEGAARRYQQVVDLGPAADPAQTDCEAVAGLANCALAGARLEDARRHALRAWEHLEKHRSVNMEHPSRPYAVCAGVFDALGDVELARSVIRAGYEDVMNRANKISDPERRESLLSNDPFNRDVVELWERGHQADTKLVAG